MFRSRNVESSPRRASLRVRMVRFLPCLSSFVRCAVFVAHPARKMPWRQTKYMVVSTTTFHAAKNSLVNHTG